MAKKKVSRKKTQQTFFQIHKHTRWLIPLLIISLVLLFVVSYTQKANNDLRSSVSVAPKNFKGIEAISRDGQKKLYNVIANENGQYKQSFFISNIDGSHKIKLLDTIENIRDIKTENWSLDGNYVFLLTTVKGRDIVYVFKSNGETFQNGKRYLSSHSLGFNLQLKKNTTQPLYWQTDTQIVLVPDTNPIYYVYILDAEKETVTKASAGD